MSRSSSSSQVYAFAFVLGNTKVMRWWKTTVYDVPKLSDEKEIYFNIDPKKVSI